MARAGAFPGGDPVSLVDDMALKAFKVVMRGVKVLDIRNGLLQLSGDCEWAEEPLTESALWPVAAVVAATAEPSPKLDQDRCALPTTSPAAVVDEVQLPPADPTSSSSSSSHSGDGCSDSSKASGTSLVEALVPTPPIQLESSPTQLDMSTTSFTYVAFPPESHVPSSSSSSSSSSSPLSPSFSSSSNNPCLVSRRLGAAHDVFLSHQGSFIGRLHLQARFPGDLLFTTQQSALACRDLVRIVDAVCERDPYPNDLRQSKEAMCIHMANLVQNTKDVLQPRSSSSAAVAAALDDIDMMTPDEGQHLMSVATRCVRAAGGCVAKARSTLTRIGDFELPSNPPEAYEVQDAAGDDDDVQQGYVVVDDDESPLPEFPLPPSTAPSTVGPFSEPGHSSDRPTPLQSPRSTSERVPSPTPSSHSESFPLMMPTPTPPATTTTMAASPIASPADSTRPSTSASTAAARAYTELLQIRTDKCIIATTTIIAEPLDSLGEDFNVGSAGTNNTSFTEMTASDVGTSSTRATSPDFNPPAAYGLSWPAPLPHQTGADTTDSPDANEDMSSLTPSKTYSHELIYNKDGQVVGGTLPALVERLTMHDSTPDPAFMSTFYLTFRLFTTAFAFAEALIDRFDYIGDSGPMAGPVRLRVYNVIKGWLESHWHKDHDCIALPILVEFAATKLRGVLPQPAQRLGELAAKASAIDGPLVPRLLSSLGKASTLAAPPVSATESPPTPAISRGQMTALRTWRQGGALPSLLDLDPLEIARQLTIRESKMFCAILPEELLAQEWTRKSGSRAGNIRAMSTFSTDLATLVAETILRVGDVKKRAAVIKHWVKIGRECLALQNYDSLMAVVCALNSSNILRLKKTWEALSQKTMVTLDQLRGVVDVSRNYAVLRQHLHSHESPCLPFVGLYLTDLTFVDVGNQTTRQLPRQPPCDGDGSSSGGTGETKSVINFDKHVKTAKIIGELQRFQVPYALTEVSELQDLIRTQLDDVRASEDSSLQNQYRRSLLLEPRDGSSSHRPTASESFPHHLAVAVGSVMTSSSSSSSSSMSYAAAFMSTSNSTTSSSTRDRFDLFHWASSNKEKPVGVP